MWAMDLMLPKQNEAEAMADDHSTDKPKDDCDNSSSNADNPKATTKINNVKDDSTDDKDKSEKKKLNIYFTSH